MRLTLRTLLAYLDDVLDPVDKEELSHKIESSEFAEDLVHRTRDTVRRLRLSAPQVIGTGMGLDPNTVAEYLDNVMPPEQVGDFERICLESDVHLAEATACHHVLTMVLGEPADVDPLARQRMYTLTTDGGGGGRRLRVEPAHTTPVAVVAAATAVPQAATFSPTVQLPPRVEIPDYLRTGAWWRSTNAVIGMAAILVVGVGVVFAIATPDWFRGKSSLPPLTVDNSAAPPADTVAANTNNGTGAPAVEAPALDTHIEPAVGAPKANDIAAAPPLGAPPQPTTPGITSLSPPQLTTPGIPPLAAAPAPGSNSANAGETDRYAVGAPPADTTTPPANDAPANTPASDPGDVGSALAGAAASAPGTTTTPAATTPPTNATASIPATLPQSDPPALIPPANSDAAAVSATAPAETSPTPPPTALAASNPTPPIPLPTTPPADAASPDASSLPGVPAALPESGTYLGGKTVLLRYDDKAGTWFRMEPRAAVRPGERLLSLPEFRPKVAMISGLHLELAGGTEVIMSTGNDTAAGDKLAGDSVPALELVYGRVVLMNPANADKEVHLKLGPTIGVAKIGHNKTLAAEVERKHVPGLDPRQAPAPVEIRLFAPEGGIVWTDPAGEKTIDKPSRWVLTAAGAGDATADTSPPEWIDHEPIVQLSEQRYGAPVIESTLVSNVPAATQLLELFQGSSRKEVKSLVARSSIHVGLFEPFIDALRDSEQKANWKTHIDTLRSAMALNTESANKVSQALIDQRGKPAAADLYEMLCGYTPEQIGLTPEQVKTGAISKLIDRLEDDSLDYRVLAIQDLWEITGKKLMPNPSASLAERTQNIKRWRSRLEAGEVKPIAQPQP